MAKNAFAEEDDVRKALQKATSAIKGQLATEHITPAIESVSRWFARQTNGYWFDSGGGTTLIGTASATQADVVLDVPSSPHAQPRQIVTDRIGARYPVPQAGPYAQIPLPHIYVTNLNKLEVRGTDGDVTDWVADGSFTEGVGDEFYLQTVGQNSYGRTYLRIDTGSIGARHTFDGLLTLDYGYGLDYQTDEWDDVRRGIANLAAAELATEDGVLTQIPESGTLVGVETEYDQLLKAADRDLGPYISDMGDNR